MTQVLSDRRLGRATLERQWLLERRCATALDAVAHLVGLQAQEPADPYLALWSRLEAFDPLELADALESRAAVRTWVMRGTIHLVTADDALVLWPLLQVMLAQHVHTHPDAKRVAERDLGPALAAARRLLDEAPRTQAELRAHFAGDAEATGLGYAVRILSPLVQTPPRGVWGKRGAVRLAHLETWTGRSLAVTPSLDDVVRRYLLAFGPASVADVATWSRLTGLREVLERLRPSLCTYRDERGRELFDVPDAPLPPEDAPAPVRFLPQFDNAVLSHADRSRFYVADEQAIVGAHNERHVLGRVLHDGFVCATWRWDGDDMVVDAVSRTTRAMAREIEAEGGRVLGFLGREGAAVRVSRASA